jgi:hypothetical protein
MRGDQVPKKDAMDWGMGRDFEAQLAGTMPRATTRGDGDMFDTAMPGLGCSSSESAWKEARGNARRRSPEQTLEGRNPKRAHAFSSRPASGREGTAMVAKRRTSARAAVRHREVAVEVRLLTGLEGSVLPWENPMNVAATSGGIAADSSEEQSARGVETPEAQRAGVGSPARRRPGWLMKLSGSRPVASFERGYVEGNRNPMRGGCASRTRAVAPSDTGRRIELEVPGGERGKTLRSPDAPAPAGHALKRKVSEESWKNRSTRTNRHPLPGQLGRWVAEIVASRTHEVRGAARKLWTST